MARSKAHAHACAVIRASRRAGVWLGIALMLPGLAVLWLGERLHTWSLPKAGGKDGQK